MEQYLLAGNTSGICRLCRESKGLMSDIFSAVGKDTSVPLSQRIMSFANVEVTEGDGLPSLICHRCLYHIEKVNEFKMLCEESDAFLRQFLVFQEETNRRIFSDKSVGTQIDLDNLTEEQMDEEWAENPQNDDEISKAMLENVEINDSLCDSEDCETNCPSCNKHFDDQSLLDRHVLIHSQDGPFPCDFCEVVEKDKASLRLHWKVHAQGCCNVCQSCGEPFPSKEALLKHHLRHDRAKPYHCDVCQKAFSYKSDLRKHSIIHTGLRPFVCPVCFKSFTRSTNLNKHAKLHSGCRPYSCAFCEKMFASKGDLFRHSVIHSGEKPYHCSICTISFNRRDKLTRHERVHTAAKPHVCPECPTSFARKEELTKHFQFHHFSPGMFYNNYESSSPAPPLLCMERRGESPANSEEGEETEAVVISVDPSHWGGEKASARKGLGTSDAERPFGCKVCEKRFLQRRELSRHMAVHTGIKPHVCPVCGKSFVRSDKLKRHLNTHTKRKAKAERQELEMANLCNLCNKLLSSKQELKRHILTHLEHKPYRCNDCAASFCRRDKLIKHIKRFHSKPHSP